MSEPTPEQLASLPYSGDSAFSRGNRAKDFRDKLYLPHGKIIRWWQAYEADPESAVRGPNGETVSKDGKIFVERTTALNGAPLNTVRVLPYRTNRNIVDPEWGLIEKSSTGLSAIPSEIEFARYDRLGMVDVTLIARNIIERGEGETDKLVRFPVVSIAEIFKLTPGSNAVLISDELYEVSENGITWLDDSIEEGTPLSVVYRYMPIWQWLCVDDQSVIQRGTDGDLLPQRGVVQMLNAHSVGGLA